MYKLIFEKKVLNDLNKVDNLLKSRVWKKLQECKENPFRFFEKLVEREGFKLRIGDWRIIADIDASEKIIHVLKFDHRKNIYDKH